MFTRELDLEYESYAIVRYLREQACSAKRTIYKFVVFGGVDIDRRTGTGVFSSWRRALRDCGSVTVVAPNLVPLKVRDALLKRWPITDKKE